MREVNMSLFLDAARGADTQRAPVWIMRQAGRYLPEYRALKERYSFWELCRTPELVLEVTLQPIRRFGFDAAILFSDIMTPLPPMGVEIDFAPGPIFRDPLRTEAQINALALPSQEEIAPFVEDAVRLIRSETPVPLIGCAHQLLERLTEVTIRYLQAQIEAGVQAVQLFDSWAGLHDAKTYAEFAKPYNRRVFEALATSGVPRIYLAVNALHLYGEIDELPCEVASVDWRVPLSTVRGLLPGKTLQGNLDPANLLAPTEHLLQEVERVLHEGLGGPHIFNLGHGIFPQTDPDDVERLVDKVKAFDRRRPEDGP
jgi:uroporphyrinogen decarboxylase